MQISSETITRHFVKDADGQLVAVVEETVAGFGVALIYDQGGSRRPRLGESAPIIAAVRAYLGREG